jgi:hypothetical protein
MRLSFAGRNSELEQLRTLYLQGRHVLIVGPPGSEKRRCSMNSGRALRFWFVKTLPSSPAHQHLQRAGAGAWPKSSRAFGIRAETSLAGPSRSLDSPLRSIMSLTLPSRLRGLWRGSLNTFPFGSRAVRKCLIKLDVSGNIYPSSSNSIFRPLRNLIPGFLLAR